MRSTNIRYGIMGGYKVDGTELRNYCSSTAPMVMGPSLCDILKTSQVTTRYVFGELIVEATLVWGCFAWYLGQVRLVIVYLKAPAY